MDKYNPDGLDKTGDSSSSSGSSSEQEDGDDTKTNRRKKQLRRKRARVEIEYEEETEQPSTSKQKVKARWYAQNKRFWQDYFYNSKIFMCKVLFIHTLVVLRCWCIDYLLPQYHSSITAFEVKMNLTFMGHGKTAGALWQCNAIVV